MVFIMSKLKFGFADTIITPINPEYVYIEIGQGRLTEFVTIFTPRFVR